jgi:hypothetical protein
MADTPENKLAIKGERPLFPPAASDYLCESAWNKDPVFGVIGIQSELRGVNRR